MPNRRKAIEGDGISHRHAVEGDGHIERRATEDDVEGHRFSVNAVEADGHQSTATPPRTTSKGIASA